MPVDLKYSRNLSPLMPSVTYTLPSELYAILYVKARRRGKSLTVWLREQTMRHYRTVLARRRRAARRQAFIDQRRRELRGRP